MKDYVSVLVIVPIFNTEKYIEKCLKSLTSQTFDDWHAVLVNDGSTDNSEKICKDYVEAYPGKFTLLSKEHGGPGSARNFGMDRETKKSKYIYFLDSDDYLEVTALEKLFNAAETAEAEVAVCGYAVHSGKVITHLKYKNFSSDKRDICRSLLECEEIGSYVWNKLFLHSLFENLRFPENCFYEDVFTTYKAILNCKKITVLSEVLYNYIRHSGSIVATKAVDSVRDLNAAFKERNKFITERYPELRETADISELRVHIFFLNQIYKKI